MWWILTLALLLRLPWLSQSLWLDEAIEALALQGHFGPILSYALSDFQPPLYHLLGQLWTSLAGFSELALRLPSLISGLLTVYFTIKIGELVMDKQLGLIAGILVATNPLLIYYSQEGRTYAMTTFFVSASFYYLFKLLTDPHPRLLHTTCYTLFTTAFLWTSYLSWFVAAPQGIYLIYKKRWDLLLPLSLAALTLLFWLPSLQSSLSIGLGDAAQIPGWGRVVGGISLKALGLTWVKLNIGRISFSSPWLYGSLVLALAFGHWFILRRVHKANPLLVVWLIIPLILASLASLFVPVYSYTRVLFIVPAYLLLLGLGLIRLPRIYTSITIILNLAFLTIFWFSPRFHREDWRSLTQDLNREQGVVVLPSLKQDAPFIYYHLSLPLRPSQDLVTSPRVYYVKYVEDAFDPSRLGPANLAQLGYTIVAQRTYPGLQLDIYAQN